MLLLLLLWLRLLLHQLAVPYGRGRQAAAAAVLLMLHKAVSACAAREGSGQQHC
jgi:hypothetical protein